MPIMITVPPQLHQKITCVKCRCAVSAGEPLLKHGFKFYHPEGRCGSTYVVRCVYIATKKDLRLQAYDAADALRKARAYFGAKEREAKPVVLKVYQGNVHIMTEALKGGGSTWLR